MRFEGVNVTPYYINFAFRMVKFRWVLSLSDVGRECPRVSRAAGHLHGHGSAPVSLLHQFLPQHISDRTTVWWALLCRNVPTGAASRVQVSGDSLRYKFGNELPCVLNFRLMID